MGNINELFSMDQGFEGEKGSWFLPPNNILYPAPQDGFRQ